MRITLSVILKKESNFISNLSIAKEIGDKFSEGKAYINLVSAHRCLGDIKKAIEFHSIAKEMGQRFRR